MPHARHAQSSLPTRMSGKGFIEPHRSHLPRRARTAKDRTKEEKPAKHTPTPLVLETPGVEDADADPLGTGATNMTEPPTSGRTIPAAPQAPEALQTTPPLPPRPSTPAQPLSTDTTTPAPVNINDADNDTDDRPLPHPAMGPTMELMNAAQAAAAQTQEQAQAQTPLPLPSLPSLALSTGLAAPLPSSTPSPSLGPGSPSPPMTAPLGQNLPRRHRRREVVKSPSPLKERDVSREKEEERKEDDFREEDRRDGEDATTTTTTPAPTPALAPNPLAADDEDRPLPHPAMGLTMHLMNAAEAQAQEQAQAQGRTLPVPPALPLPPLPNTQTLGGISSSMPLPLPLQMGTPPLGPGSPTPPITAPLISAAATPLGTNLPRRHRRREVVKSPSPSRERERERSRVRDKDGEMKEERKEVDQKDASAQGKTQPVRVLRFERPAGGVGVGSPPKAGAMAGALGLPSSLPTFPLLGTSPKTNHPLNTQARPQSTSRSRSRPRARPRASTDVGARHASSSRTRDVSERDVRRLAREARRKERGERERRMCVQVLGRDFGVGGGGVVGEGEGEVYGGRVEVGFLDDEAEGIEENEKEEYVLLRAIRPRVGKRMKKRDSISSASSSTSSLTFDSGSSSEESSSESEESESDFASDSESNNELSAIPSWFPWLTTYFPSSSSSSSTSTSALAATDSRTHIESRPTTLKLVLKPQPQSTSNNASAKPNKVYDYIEGTSALSEEQIREGCEFMKGWLDDSSEGVDEEDLSRTRTRIRILSPRNRPEDAFAIGLCYLAWAEKCVQHQQEINVDPPSPEGPSSSSPFMFSASTTTTSTSTVPISVPTLSIPISFPSLASALSPAVTDYRSPTSPTTPGPGAGAARLRAHAPVRPTFMSRTTSMSTARPGGGVPPVLVTPAGLMARMASLGGGRGTGVGLGVERRGRGLERKVRMAVVDWGVNDLPPPVSEDVDVDVTSTPMTGVKREVSVSDTVSITSLPRDDSNSNSDELSSSSEEHDEQPQLLPPPPDIYTLSHLHHLYMRLLDDQEVYHPPDSDDTSASVSAVGWMGRGALYEARLKADASAAAVNVGGGLGLDELCLDEEDEEGEDDYDDEEESTHTAELKESNSDTAGSSLNAEEVRGRLRERGVLVHGREAAMGGRDVSSVGASFGGAFAGGAAVNDIPGQDEDGAKVLDHKPSLRGLGHKLSLSTIDRKASFRRAKERDARRRERDLKRKEREERRGARDKPVWKGLRDEWRGVLSFEGVQGLVGVWP